MMTRRKTIDTYTGLSWPYNETLRHPLGPLVPARTAKRRTVLLHPSRVLPDLLRELNPHASREVLRTWKDTLEAA